MMRHPLLAHGSPLALPPVPDGFKTLAWSGLQMAVPWDWEIGRHEGDQQAGALRLEGFAGVVGQVRWQRQRRPIPAQDVIARLGKSLWKDAPEAGKPVVLGGAGLDAAALGDGATAFTVGVGDEASTLVVSHRADLGRLTVWRLAPGLERATRDVILRHLAVRHADAWRSWAALDFAGASPPEVSLREAHLGAGVIELMFGCGRRHVLRLRRYSAADASMAGLAGGAPLDQLEGWCRRVFADAFFDMRYDVAGHLLGDGGGVGDGVVQVRLRGRRRWLAPLEFRGLLPRHRQTPRRVDVYWHRQANKIVTIEAWRDGHEAEAMLEEAAGRIALQLPPEACGQGDAVAAAVLGPGKPAGRRRSLGSVARLAPETEIQDLGGGRLRLVRATRRPVPLRGLRVLAGLPAGDAVHTHRVELDAMGAALVHACVARATVASLVAMTCERHRLTWREAERVVVHQVQALGQRGMLVLEVPEGERAAEVAE